MAGKKASRSTPKSKSWKDIDQDVKAKSMSAVALKRKLFSRCRKFALVFTIVVAVFLGARAFLMTEDISAALTKAGQALPLKFVESESDALSHDWILNYLGLNKEGLNLLGIDLEEMKDDLESHPQIKSAGLVRQLPETLFISIQEREPVAKIIASDVERGKVTLLVDRDGVVYEGTGYEKKRIRALPSLDGIRLKRTEGRFNVLEGMDSVDDLLTEARNIAPHLYRSWKVVSLERLPDLVVRSNFAKEMVFEESPSGYRRQLAELDYIIDYHRSRSLSQVARIDLTMKSQVPVTKATIAQ